jgi:hypothetical protein
LWSASSSEWPEAVLRFPAPFDNGPAGSNLRTRIRSRLSAELPGPRLTRGGGGWDSNPRPPGPQLCQLSCRHRGQLGISVSDPGGPAIPALTAIQSSSSFSRLAPRVSVPPRIPDQLLVEGRNVVRLATHDEPAVDVTSSIPKLVNSGDRGRLASPCRGRGKRLDEGASRPSARLVPPTRGVEQSRRSLQAKVQRPRRAVPRRSRPPGRSSHRTSRPAKDL